MQAEGQLAELHHAGLFDTFACFARMRLSEAFQPPPGDPGWSAMAYRRAESRTHRLQLQAFFFFQRKLGFENLHRRLMNNVEEHAANRLPDATSTRGPCPFQTSRRVLSDSFASAQVALFACFGATGMRIRTCSRLLLSMPVAAVVQNSRKTDRKSPACEARDS